MINIRIKRRFWSIVLFLPIFFIALNCSNYTNRITNFDSRKDQIRKKYINDGFCICGKPHVINHYNLSTEERDRRNIPLVKDGHYQKRI